MQNYENKFFSVLGDSISTLNGCTEPNEAAFYQGMVQFEADIFLQEDTWWGKVISHFGGFLLRNHSFSGSTVHRSPWHEIESYACSHERTSALHREDQLPDVIMIFMGINDWGGGTKLRPEKETEREDISFFSVAYQTMLERLRVNYPEAELWCFTLPVSTCTKKENFHFPYCYGGEHIEKYCEIIRACASESDARLIDLYTFCEPYDTIDGFHPNANGMKTLAEGVIRAWKGEKIL